MNTLDSKWATLSQKEKSDIIRVAINNGIKTLPEIREAYNKFAEGGPERTDSFSLGGNLFDNGGNKSSKKSSGYTPSQRLMRDIATWEGSEMERNAPFSEVTRQFNATVPASVRTKLTTNQLDALYSYGYNVGMGNLKKRVLPTLTSYIEGKASNEDVQKSMWASKDNVLRGLTRRRNWEREMFGGNYRTKFTGEGIGAHYDPTLFQLSQSSMDETNNMINNVTLPSIVDNTPDPEFAYTPPTIDETLFRTPKVEIPEVTYDPKQDKIDGITRFNTVMGLMGQSTPFSGLVGSGSSGLLDAVGKIYS